MKRMALSLALACFASIVSAQLLTNGNSQLPACGASCALLNQASQACGGTTTTNPIIWNCFCQSSYLANLYISPVQICDASCTSASDNQQVMTWYKSNCGTDNGASEHAASGGTTTTVVEIVSTSTPTAKGTASVSTGGASLPSTTASGGSVASDDDLTDDSHWWSRHYKWVIMLIVLFIGLTALGLLATWLKRRHDRKADQVRNGFNTGITTRSTPVTAAGPAGPAPPAADLEPGNGRNSPAPPHDAFMPYGYSYSRSESRVASPRSGSRADQRRSALSRSQTPADSIEKVPGTGGHHQMSESAPKQQGRKVLVRERSGDNEKS